MCQRRPGVKTLQCRVMELMTNYSFDDYIYLAEDKVDCCGVSQLFGGRKYFFTDLKMECQ